MAKALSITPKARFAAACSRIRELLDKVQVDYADLGWELESLRTNRSWESAGYQTFEDACMVEFGLSPSTTSRRIKSAKYRQLIAEIAHSSTWTERAMREFIRLDADKHNLPAAARKVLKAAGGKVVTAAVVKKVVDKIVGRKTKTKAPGPQALEVVFVTLSRVLDARRRQLDKIRTTAGTRAYMRDYPEEVQRLDSAIVELTKSLRKFRNSFPSPSESKR